MKFRNFTLRVVVDGEALPERFEPDTRVAWVTATKGREFSILLGNGTAGRVRVVPSVDGVSVVDGEPAKFDSTGYLLRGGAEMLIPGWRIDDVKVARFMFDAVQQSYALRADGGDPRNIGVIAASFFGESVASAAELLAGEVAQDVSACWARRTAPPDAIHDLVCSRAHDRVEVWEQAASGGSVGASWLLAVCHLYRVPPSRFRRAPLSVAGEQRRAVQVIERCAGGGFPLAQYSLAGVTSMASGPAGSAAHSNDGSSARAR